MYLNSNGDESSQISIEGDDSVHEGVSHLNGQRRGVLLDYRRSDLGCEKSGSKDSQEDKEFGDVPPCLSAGDGPVEARLVPVTLYQHRVRGLVLVLLVEPQFHNDMAAMEEVVRK